MPKSPKAESQIHSLKQEIERLERINKAKSMVLSILAHNALPSLKYMYNVTGLYLGQWNDLSRQEIEKCTSFIHDTSGSLYNLSESIVDWTQHDVDFEIKAGTKVYLVDLLEEEIKLFKPLLNEKELKISLMLDNKHYVKAEKAIVRLVIQNLISNAIKFSLIGGLIQIYSEMTVDGLELVVKDEGVGMSRKQLETLGTSSKRVTTKGTRNEKGYGLGLYISDNFMTQLGGKISISSKLGEGTAVHLFFPQNGF